MRKKRSYWTDLIEVGEPEACWRWLGCHDEKGYARARLSGRNGTTARVHRLIASLTEDIKGSIVHHSCENKSCVNPRHLAVKRTHREHALEHRVCDHSDRYLAKSGRTQCRVCRRERYQNDPSYREREQARSRTDYWKHREQRLPQMREYQRLRRLDQSA